jgi:predicted enzyme related to lactoylglutathione lyase
MTISHVKVLTVPVSDQDRAKQFYARGGHQLVAGVAVDGPSELPWGRQATFTDPDGNDTVMQDAAI